MKERPILFSAPMVRALLNGSKTQTRRIMKVQPDESDRVTVEPFYQTVVDRSGEEQPGPQIFGAWWADGECGLKSPYGQPGDRLWVKETGWQRPERTPKMMREGADTWAPYYFDADGLSEQDHADFKAWGFKRRPSIFMPRECSRITLEVTSVRVERLNDISYEDALAEGVADARKLVEPECREGETADQLARRLRWPQREYELLWEQINGLGSWAANHWVWVVEFKRLTARAKGE